MHTKMKRLLFLSLTVVLLFGTGMLLTPMQKMRADYDLSSDPVKGLSPQLALATQVLGWGRGIIIDVIWLRMESLKRENRFFELVQLADWACKLAPRYPQVWDIQAWNLAYNVSCLEPNLPDRWAWVWSGITLLRDQGIPNNPNSSRLYQSLAWTLFHKIGEQDDNAHFFYKQKFGLMMHEVLGGPAEKATLQRFAAAPKSREELLKDADVKRLNDECAVEGFDIADGFFDYYLGTAAMPGAAQVILKRSDNAAALAKIEVYARAKRLRDEFKLDPQLMVQIDERYKDDQGRDAPFDWRSPYPHAIYWATVGLQKLDAVEKRTLTTLNEFGVPIPKPHEGENFGEDETLYEFDRVSLKRVIYAAMQSLSMHGRLLFDAHGRLLLEMGTDYRFADATLPLVKEVIDLHGKRFQMGAQDALAYFLSRGVFEFSNMGDSRKAKAYFDELQEKFPWITKGKVYEEWVQSELARTSLDMTSTQARGLITAYLVRAFFALGCNADDKSNALMNEVEQFAQKWNEKAEPNLRGLVRLDTIKDAVLCDVLTGRYNMPEDVQLNLKQRYREVYGEEKFNRLMAQLKARPEGVPLGEEVTPDMKVETY